MLIITDGPKHEVVNSLDPCTSAFASCVATLANSLVGVRPHVPGSSERAQRTQLLASGVYAPGVGVARQIVSLPAARILRVYDVDTGIEARRTHGTALSLALSLDDASVTSTECLQIGAATFELRVRQFIDAPDRAAVSTSITLRRIDGDDAGPRSVRMDFGIDTNAVNEYLGTASWLTTRHYDIQGCIYASDRFELALAVANVRLRYEVHILRSPTVGSTSAAWEIPQGGCAISTTFDFSATNPHRTDVHWELRSAAMSNCSQRAQAPAEPLAADCAHREHWRRIWEEHDVTIKAYGHPVELGIRYAAFQLLQHGLESHRQRHGFLSPARGLTSTYHSGATFFDTELHKCIFWIWNDPRVARALIDFRYLHLRQAIEFSASTGFSGARFPEATNDRATENGPHYIFSYPDTKAIREWSVDEVLHISADVCYALHRYHEASGDDNYMSTRGYRMIAACASFAASVFIWSNSKQAYVINSVMGPDEYHYHVNNSFFTNYMLRWCIKLALASAGHAGFPEVSTIELNTWRVISDMVYLPWMKVDGVFIPEEFEGYAKLPDIEHRSKQMLGPRFGCESERMAAYGLENFRSMAVKQADVVLLMSLFPDDFPSEVKRAAFDFYEPRTVHESSLSYGPHAMVAADIGRPAECADFIARSSRYNLDFTSTADYANGLHLSAYAGAWQGLVEGLAGLRVENNELSFRPRLPSHWDAYRFTLHFRGRLLKITVPADGIIRAEYDGNALTTSHRVDGRIYLPETGP